FLGVRAQSNDLQLADLVGEGLPGPADVAIDLVRDVDLGQRGVLAHVGLGLLARPAHRMDPGIDDEPRAAPRVVRQLAEPIEVRRAARADRGRTSTAPSRRRAARCTAPSPRRTPSSRRACETPASRRAPAPARSAYGGRGWTRARSAPRARSAAESPACTC